MLSNQYPTILLYIFSIKLNSVIINSSHLSTIKFVLTYYIQNKKCLDLYARKYQL